jgi:hypothetical protein
MNKPAIFASALAIVAGGFALWQRVLVQRAEVSVSNLSAERSDLHKEVANLKQRLELANQRMVQSEMQAASLKDDLSQLFSKKDASAPSTRSMSSTPSTTAIAPGGRPQQGWVMGLARRGGSLSLRPAQPARDLNTTYHVLYRQLKLSPEHIEQFKATMTEAATQFEDLEREAKTKRVSATDRTMRPLYAKVDSELRAKLVAQFGPDALPVIERFTETLFLRDAVTQVATELFYTPAPLTEPQANQLVDILAKNMRDPAGRLDLAFADSSAIKAEAARVLSPPQLLVWREWIDYLAKTAFASLNPHRR